MGRFKLRLMTILCLIMIMVLTIPQNTYALSTPATPTGLIATAVSDNQINLSWNSASEASQYYIYRSNSVSGEYTYMGAVAGTSFSNTGLMAATTYYYKIQGINSVGSSSYSSAASAKTLGSSGTSTEIQSDRIFGANRYETSAEIAAAGWSTSSYAVLASGENFPDALCASPLAAKFKAPILLTSKNKLEEPTKNQFLSLNVKNVIIVGGEGVISAKVEKDIKNLGITVSRASGMNRYETSLEVAKMIGSFDEAVVATGSDFADILSVAPIAAQKGMPILLTPKNSISNALKNLLDKNVDRTYVLGDADTINATVVNKLPSPQRLYGTNPYDANIKIIEYFANDLDLSTVYVATGEAYPDALSGSVFAARSYSPVILIKSSLQAASEKFIAENSGNIDKAVAFGGTGAISDTLLKSIAPSTGEGTGNLPTPSNVVANTIDTNQVYLTWNTISNANTYIIYRGTSYSGTYTDIATVSNPYYLDTYLPSGITYYYKIKAANSSGTSAYSNIAQATTQSDANLLQAPGNLVATPLTTDEIHLTWYTVPNAVTYNVYRTKSDSGVYTIIDSVNYPYYTDDNVASGATYLYKVQAANSRGTGPYSSVVIASPLLSTDGLAVPTNVVALSKSSNQILLTWNAAVGATHYKIYRSTSYSGTYTNIANLTLPYYIDEGLTAGMTYYYKVQAVSNAGSSGFSTIAYTVTGEGSSSLVAPNNLTATTLNSSQIYLAWNAVPNATYYKIYRSTSSNGNYALINTNVNPYYTDRNLSAKTTYYYYVEAANDSKTSGKSSNASARTTN
ncbi:putative cell wall binding repeat 2-containing protein [Desulfitobacterium hafniense DCB-2]|uniref:Putative cell wall binding repeat 2-containing protein n=1 Tax=Desulfitobacterium hafniense (strain DSM 10664 / DCB-2) TaxID=272564 RepID=B8FWI5_DESHD|nr:cell wall-binding repeat-containing protein [Desulfitobacterium hafniense]ACL22483.1 putative cell wall binding repeat 2-containing protein [Desulfitobacterium hafniense DCB-2]